MRESSYGFLNPSYHSSPTEHFSSEKMWKVVFLLAAFVASVTTQCAPDGSSDLTVPLQGTVSIMSPNFPEKYPDNSNCQWTITGSNTTHPGLEVNCPDFDLEGGSCSYDYLTVIQIGTNGSEVQLGRFCGTTGPRKLVSATSSIKMVFRTDSYINKFGFGCTVKEHVCTNGSSLCPGSGTECIRPSQWCDGELNCPGGVDEGSGCSGECGMTSIPPKEDENAMQFRNLVAVRGKGPSSRIVGGTEAIPHSLPWQAAMMSWKGSQICGASIIHGQWLMTAAHCCMSYAPVADNYRVRVGAHDLGATNESYAKTYTLEKLIVHPSYQRPSRYSNDFCLLKIAGIFEYGAHVGAICLADEDDCPAGSAVMSSGWGDTHPVPWGDQVSNFDEQIKHIKDAEKGLLAKVDDPEYGTPRVSATLRQIYVDVTTQDACEVAYGTSDSPDVTPDMICASRAGKGVCHGDSGGSFVQKDSEGVWKLCGVVSWTGGCAQDGYPGVYARMSTAREWAEVTIWSE